MCGGRTLAEPPRFCPPRQSRSQSYQSSRVIALLLFLQLIENLEEELFRWYFDWYWNFLLHYISVEQYGCSRFY